MGMAAARDRRTRHRDLDRPSAHMLETFDRNLNGPDGSSIALRRTMSVGFGRRCPMSPSPQARGGRPLAGELGVSLLIATAHTGEVAADSEVRARVGELVDAEDAVHAGVPCVDRAGGGVNRCEM